jgi:hypothetical protein
MRLGLAVALVSGLAAVAPASGHEFTAKTAAGTLSGKGTSNQSLTMTVGKWACEQLAITGSIAATRSAALTTKAKLSECEPQGPLWTMKYWPVAGKSRITQASDGMKYTSSGGECGASGVEMVNGEYSGEGELEEVGGGLDYV